MPVRDYGYSPAATAVGARAQQRSGVTALIGLAQAAAPARRVPAFAFPAGRTAEAQAVAPKPQTPQSRLWWVLPLILGAQAALSARLVWSNTAFADEALYLWAGHIEWTHWLYGTKLPDFQTYFSGAPVVYPPLGALADTYGGLAGARLLSLCFMLWATVLMHGATRRMFGRRAAGFAAALFAGMTSVQFLGAFATYDAMALSLVALAVWLGIRALKARPAGAFVLLVASAATLTVADATKYAAALFTPPVVLTVALVAAWLRGRKAGVKVGAIMLASLSLMMTGVLLLGGPLYWRGIAYTTLAREHGTYPASFLLYVSGKWTGALALLAIFGAIGVGFAGRRFSAVLLGCVLAGAVFLAPLEQARIHTYTSLFKHVGYGALFGAIMAGYCLASFRRAVAPAKVTTASRMAVGAVLLAAVPAFGLASSHYGWPDTTRIMPVMRDVLSTTSGPVLADDRGNVLDYYLPGTATTREISGTFFFAYNDPGSGKHLVGQPAYADAIKDRYFSVIFVEFYSAPVTDRWIEADVKHYGGYRLVATLPYKATGHHGDAMIWVRS